MSVVGAAGGVGTSTLALLLSAAVCEGHGEAADVVLVEADRSGGVVGARWQLGVNPGLGGWVSALAADRAASVVPHGRQAVKGLRVVPGPPGWVAAEKVVTAQTVELLASAMSAESNRWWTVDVGRGCSVVRPLVGASAAVVVVSSGAPEEVAGLVELVGSFRPARCVLVLGSRSAWPAGEVLEHCGADAVVSSGVACLDGVGAVGLIEGRRRRRDRSWRTALEVRDQVIEVVGSGGVTATDVAVADRSVS